MMDAQARPPLTPWQKACYGFGTLGPTMLDRALLMWIVVYYIPAEESRPQLLHPAVFSVIMIAGRVVDAIVDPVIAKWSDSSHARIGRRSVFMLWNGLPLAICTILAFYAPIATPQSTQDGIVNAGYLALVLAGFFIFFTAYVAPYLALFPEIVTEYRERVSLGTWKAYFGLAGLMGGMLLSPILVDRFGYQGMIWAIALPALVCMYIPFAGINEREMCRGVPSATPLVQSLLATLRNGPFVRFLIARQTFDFGFNMIVVTIPFYAILVLKKEEAYVSALLGGTFAVTLATMAPLGGLAKRIGKKRALMISMGLFVVLLPALSATGHPLNPVPPVLWGHVCLALSGIPLAFSLLLAEPFIAAVSDLDREATGEQREAMYFGAQGFFSKVFIGLAGAGALYIMSKFGTTPNAVPVAEGVLLVGPIAGAFCVLGLWMFRKYPEKFDTETGTYYLDYDTSRMRAHAAAAADAGD